MNEELGRFVEQIMTLAAGSRWPSMGGDITQRLQQSTMQFAQALQAPRNYSRAQVQTLAQEIEGLLLAEEAVYSWGQAATNKLVGTLHDLTPK